MVRPLPLLAAAVLFACSSPEAPAPAGAGGAPAAAAQPEAKTLTVKGSDTMVLLAQRVAEKFMADHPGRTVQVTGGGSGTGIAALINGTTDIASSSRPMKDEERKQVQAKRNAPVEETKVALDGIAIYVHTDNKVAALTLDQIRKIYTKQLTNWKEVGGADAPIVIYSRENNSGTYAYFKEHVLQEDDFAPEAQTLPGTAAVVNAVGKDKNAIGYGGIAYDTGVRTVPVKADDGAAPVVASEATVHSGEYPISRPLFLYTAGKPTGVAEELIRYALSDAGQAVIKEVGYYPLPKTPPAPTPATGAGGASGTTAN